MCTRRKYSRELTVSKVLRGLVAKLANTWLTRNPLLIGHKKHKFFKFEKHGPINSQLLERRDTLSYSISI